MSWTSEMEKEIRQIVNDEMTQQHRAIDYKDIYNMMALIFQEATHNKRFDENVRSFLKTFMEEDKPIKQPIVYSLNWYDVEAVFANTYPKLYKTYRAMDREKQEMFIESALDSVKEGIGKAMYDWFETMTVALDEINFSTMFEEFIEEY